ncbi:MAG: iron-containing alcohol dehydrogenase, partial [Candidatus Avispirillum sp.]
CLPDEALIWEGWLEGLPDRQKVATMLDALCQAIESYWSVASNEQSGALALLAIRKIMSYGDDYILRPYDKKVAWEIMEASSLAGQAIQITRTTAPHAMAYALTTEYGVPHGEAVALNLPGVWERMLLAEEVNDERGREAVFTRFDKIASEMGAGSVSQAIDLFRKKLVLYGVKAPSVSEKDASRLVASVNVERLSNNPLKLSVQDLGIIYKNL